MSGVVERLTSRLVADANGCHIWTGSENGKGYGRIQVRGTKVGTHRLAWELANGPIPDGLHVLHRCDVRPCCNPAHLFLGTCADNGADMAAKGRSHQRAKTHCPNGHPYDDTNTSPRGSHRACRACARERAQRNRDRKRGAALVVERNGVRL